MSLDRCQPLTSEDEVSTPSNVGRSITVGPHGEFRAISAAVAASRPYDMIEVSSDIYHDDTCVIDHPLTIMGVMRTPLLLSTDMLRNSKAILITRANVTLQNLAFRGATALLGNGSGIRHEAGTLVLRNCVFRNNQNGVLAAENPAAQVHVDNCRFIGNGAGDGHTHGIYAADEIAALIITNSIFVGTIVGHHIKSRARYTAVIGNTIGDGITVSSSYDIEFPNGGAAYVQRNRLFHGATAQNRTSVCYGAEGLKYADNYLEICDNIFENSRSKLSVGILNYSRSVTARIGNNSFKGFSINHLGYRVLRKSRATTLDHGDPICSETI